MKKVLILIICALTSASVFSQLKINEISYANKSTIADEDGEYKGWAELYNAGSSAVNLDQYYLSDKRSKPSKFRLPTKLLAPGEFQIIYLSSKNRGAYTSGVSGYHWEGAIKIGDACKYKVSDATITSTWVAPGFNDASWLSGASSIGYGDGDDATIVPNCYSVYMRFSFSIPDTSKIDNALLHMDYDDGFVAYMNGVEIARSGLLGSPPAWDEVSADHEAIMYGGAPSPESFPLDVAVFKSALRTGTNIFSLEIHNSDILSSDLTSTPYLTLGVDDAASYFSSPPAWLASSFSGNIHSNFQLENTGDSLYLNNLSLVNQNKVGVYDLNLNESAGLLNDGSSNYRYFDTPTPGSSNNGSIGYLTHFTKPIISLSSGIYNGTINVSIVNTAGGGSVVRYTVDGQTPTSASPIYSSILSFSTTTILKARCFSAGSILPSASTSATYIMNDSFTVPVYSINADDVDLYGGWGIIDNPWYTFKVPCHIDIFDENKMLVASQNSAIKVDGGAGGSRYNPQRSFRLDYDHKIFGDKEIDAVLLPDKPNTEHTSSSYLRNGSNFWNNVFFKEGFMERCSNADTFAIYNAYRPIVVFINGQYFGLYELREKYTDDFLKNEFDCDNDSTDILSVSYSTGAGVIQTLEGSDTGWYATHAQIMSLDPASPAFYDDAKTRLDCDNYADYFATENWWTNFDWLWNNMKAVRMRNLDNRWKMALQDMEWGLAGWGNYWDNGYDYVASNTGNTFVDLYYKLLENNKYKNFYINRYADLMNTAFLQDSTNKKLEQMWSEARPEWRRQILRWQDSDTNNVSTHIDEFLATKNAFKDFIDNRSAYARDQTIAQFGLVKKVDITLDVYPPGAGQVRISTVTAPQYPWTGVYFDGNPVEISAKANVGYAFANWTSNSFIADTLLNSFSNNMDSNTTFVANFIVSRVDITEPLIAADQINVYPNPSNNFVTIELNFEGKKELTIYNENGAEQTKHITNDAYTTISTNALANGVYVVQVKKGQQTINKKLVVIH